MTSRPTLPELSSSNVPLPTGADRQLYTPAINQLATIATPPTLQRHLALGQTLRLVRMWPQSATELAVCYADASGQQVVGQWFADAAAREKCARRTARAVGDQYAHWLCEIPAHNLLLQAQGVDRELPGLATLAGHPDSEIIVHRPHRRGVVRLRNWAQHAHESPAPVTYAKAVRPRQASALAAAMRQIHAQTSPTDASARPAGFITPAVLDVDATNGTIVLAPLPGRPLLAWYATRQLPQAAHAAGSALRALHDLALPGDIAPHDADAEVGVLTKWFARLATIAPTLPQAWTRHLDCIASELRLTTSAPVLLHRDFYDKQVFIQATSPNTAPTPSQTGIGQVGILDFDTLAR
ncbi:MAG: hypothetical protein WDZ49_06355, partial [Litorilinea sp.]